MNGGERGGRRGTNRCVNQEEKLADIPPNKASFSTPYQGYAFINRDQYREIKEKEANVDAVITNLKRKGGIEGQWQQRF